MGGGRRMQTAYETRSSAVAQRPRDAPRHWTFCKVTQAHSRSIEIIALSTAYRADCSPALPARFTLQASRRWHGKNTRTGTGTDKNITAMLQAMPHTLRGHKIHLTSLLSASLYFSKRGAYWDRLCRDVVGRWLSRACTVAKRCILGL